MTRASIPTATAVTLLIATAIHAARLVWPGAVETALCLENASLASEPWRILTGPMIHTLVPHFLFNAVTLWVFGGDVERRFGIGVFIGVFAAGLVVGHAAQLLVLPLAMHGMSDGVCALVGFLVVADAKDSSLAAALRRPRYVAYAAALVALFVASRLGWLRIANVSHVAAIVSGALIGTALVGTSHRLARALATATAATVVIAAGSWRYEQPWRNLPAAPLLDCAIDRRPIGDVTKNDWVRLLVRDESRQSKVISYVDPEGRKVLVSNTTRREYRLYPYLGTVWRIERDGRCLAQVEVTRAGRLDVR